MNPAQFDVVKKTLGVFIIDQKEMSYEELEKNLKMIIKLIGTLEAKA